MTDVASSTRSLPSLAARAQLGDRGALEELLRRFQPALADHIGGIVRDDAVAADVLQDTLVIICRKLGTVRQTEWVRAWAYRVATREALRTIRRRARDLGEPVEDLSTIPEPPPDEASIETDDLLAELPGKLAALPLAAQTVLRLHYLQSLTQREIAEALEIPIGTVKSRIAYGLMCLRKAWAP